MASSSRFSEVEEEKITEIIDAAIPENTKRQTTWSVSVFSCVSVIYYIVSLFSIISCII